MRRLMFVVPDFYPNNSGYANACMAFVLALAKRTSYEIDVLTFAKLDGHPEMTTPRINIIRLPKKKILGFSSMFLREYHLWRHIDKLVRKRSHDFIIFETAEFPVAGILSLRTVGYDRVIVRVHAASETEWALYRRRPFKHRLKRYPTRLFFRRVRTIFSTTRYYIGFVQKRFLSDDPLLISAKYFQVIPNLTIREGEREVDEQVGSLRSSLGDYIVFMTLGRLNYHGELQKNVGRLLLGLSLLRGRSYFERLRLMVVGSGQEKIYLQRLCTELSIDANVIFYDSLPNVVVQGVQKWCQGVVQASTFEGTSIFAAEGLANGAPLLLARSGGLIDLVDDGDNGLLFDPLDVYDIAEKIDLYVTKYLPKVDEVRKCSLRKYDAQFREERVVGTFVESLDLLSAMRRARR